MPQYTLSLPLAPIYAPENFITSACNAEAYAWIMRWPEWNAQGLFLHGPAGSGKTHLAEGWRARAGAGRIEATALGQHPPDAGHWLIEDITSATDLRALLHWLNYAREQGGSVLLTSRLTPVEAGGGLPDLSSRLVSLSSARIDQPDDTVLSGAMRKQFADRQLAVDDSVIAYILARIERSLAEIARVVHALDAAALAERKPVTIPLVKKVLDARA